MYYTVGNQHFKNKFLATSHALKTNQEVHFDLYDSVFNTADWMHEPSQTWDQLLDIRAEQIRAKNKPIVLNFSGGTDSYTIYKVFERNNIHIDLLYWRRRKTDFHDSIHQQVIELLKNGIYDPTTKIIVRDDSSETFARAYDNEDWLWNSQARSEFGLGFNGDFVTDGFIAEQLGTDDFVSVIGLEKPRLRIDWHGAYSYQIDHIFQRVIENPHNTDCFYVTPELPELHIKQSYMLLKYIKSLNSEAKPKDLVWLSDNIDKPDVFNWDTYAKACGRFGDLTYSGVIHNGWNKMELSIPNNGKFYGNEHRGPSQNWFSSLVGTKTFENYTRGIMSVKNDPVGQYLFSDPQNFYKVKMFRSTMHRMDFLAA
jgi:hypothetical protein